MPSVSAAMACTPDSSSMPRDRRNSLQRPHVRFAAQGDGAFAPEMRANRWAERTGVFADFADQPGHDLGDLGCFAGDGVAENHGLDVPFRKHFCAASSERCGVAMTRFSTRLKRDAWLGGFR